MKRAGAMTGTRIACLGSLAEGIPEDWAGRMMAQGIVPLNGFAHGLRAIELAATPPVAPGWRPHAARRMPGARVMIDEAAAKSMLAAAGLPVPAGCRTADADQLAEAASG